LREGSLMGMFKADPYSIRVRSKSKTFAQILADVMIRPLDLDAKDSRWGIHLGHRVAIDNLKGTSPIVGTAFRARLSDLEKKAGRTGIEDPQLDEDDGFGKHVAFLWDPEKERLWFQRDRALSVGTFLDYLMLLSEISLKRDPIFHPDAVQRVMKMKTLKSFTVSLQESMENSPEIENAKHVVELMALRKKYKAARIKVIIETRPRDFLGIEARRLARETARLVELGQSEIKAAKVRGLVRVDDDSEEEESQLIDLLKDRVLFAEELKDERIRQPGPLMAAIRRVWSQYSDDIA
jgi:hypothetical protein